MRTFAFDMEKKIQRLFGKACGKYQLLRDGDKVLVALSGGKDSLELLRLMARQARIHKPRIEVEAAHVIMTNIPYETDRSYLQDFCNRQGVKLHILTSSFDESTDKRKTHCFLCAWNRRKAMFRFAEENGFTKIALGHHMDDFCVTALMNMTFEGSFTSMTPIMKMRHYPLEVIRPMCLVHEDMIRTVAEQEGFHKQKTPCPYEQETQRNRMTEIFHLLEKENPEARYSIFRALEAPPLPPPLGGE